MRNQSESRIVEHSFNSWTARNRPQQLVGLTMMRSSFSTRSLIVCAYWVLLGFGRCPAIANKGLGRASKNCSNTFRSLVLFVNFEDRTPTNVVRSTFDCVSIGGMSQGRSRFDKAIKRMRSTPTSAAKLEDASGLGKLFFKIEI